jgi:hypothetical protein
MISKSQAVYEEQTYQHVWSIDTPPTITLNYLAHIPQHRRSLSTPTPSTTETPQLQDYSPPTATPDCAHTGSPLA